MVRLKGARRAPPLAERQFQFLMVRLKAVGYAVAVDLLEVFQFLMVRLKAEWEMAREAVKILVSIPYGSIKSAVARRMSGAERRFNSLWFD